MDKQELIHLIARTVEAEDQEEKNLLYLRILGSIQSENVLPVHPRGDLSRSAIPEELQDIAMMEAFTKGFEEFNTWLALHLGNVRKFITNWNEWMVPDISYMLAQEEEVPQERKDALKLMYSCLYSSYQLLNDILGYGKPDKRSKMFTFSEEITAFFVELMNTTENKPLEVGTDEFNDVILRIYIQALDSTNPVVMENMNTITQLSSKYITKYIHLLDTLKLDKVVITRSELEYICSLTGVNLKLFMKRRK